MKIIVMIVVVVMKIIKEKQLQQNHQAIKKEI